MCLAFHLQKLQQQRHQRGRSFALVHHLPQGSEPQRRPQTWTLKPAGKPLQVQPSCGSKKEDPSRSGGLRDSQNPSSDYRGVLPSSCSLLFPLLFSLVFPLATWPSIQSGGGARQAASAPHLDPADRFQRVSVGFLTVKLPMGWHQSELGFCSELRRPQTSPRNQTPHSSPWMTVPFSANGVFRK